MISPRRGLLLMTILGILLSAWALHPGASGAAKDGSSRGPKAVKKRSRNDSKKKSTENKEASIAGQTPNQSDAASVAQGGQNGAGGPPAGRAQASGQSAKRAA